MQVTVKLPTGKNFPFDCNLNDKFEILKRKIVERYSEIPYDHLIVLF